MLFARKKNNCLSVITYSSLPKRVKLNCLQKGCAHLCRPTEWACLHTEYRAACGLTKIDPETVDDDCAPSFDYFPSALYIVVLIWTIAWLFPFVLLTFIHVVAQCASWETFFVFFDDPLWPKGCLVPDDFGHPLLCCQGGWVFCGNVCVPFFEFQLQKQDLQIP